MTAAAAAPLANVDNITMYGSDNSTKLVREVTGITNQVMAGLKENGIDIYDIITKALNNKA